MKRRRSGLGPRRATLLVPALVLSFLAPTGPASWAGDDERHKGVVAGAATAGTTDTEAGPPADLHASGLAAAGPAPNQLAVWNHDMHDGPLGQPPTYWSAGASTPWNSAGRVVSPSPFPRYTAAGERHTVVKVADHTPGRATLLRSRPADARPGSRYSAAGSTMTSSGSPALLFLEFLDRHGRRLSLTRQHTPPVTRPGTITWARVAAVAPAGTGAVRLLIYSSRATTGTSYWQRVFLYVQDRVAYRPNLGRSQVLFVGNDRVEAVSHLDRRVRTGVKYTTTAQGPTPVYDGLHPPAGVTWHVAQVVSVVRESDGYRMWFTAKTTGRPWALWMARSADGRTFGPGREVLSNISAGGVVRNPDRRDPSKRYLMLGVDGIVQMRITRLPMPPVDASYRAYSSPDGLTWRPLSREPVLPGRDVATVSYDASRGLFVASTKQASGQDRQFYLSTSKDFRHWSTPRRTFHSDRLDGAHTDVYAAATFRYGAQLLAFPVMYTTGLRDGVNGPLRPLIASSADGVTFSRPPDRRASIPLGRPGSTDAGMILTASNVVNVGDRVRLYYTGWNAGHESPQRSARIFLAEWPKDRFVAMHARPGGGSLLTKPLTLSGSRLTVNADPGRTGHLQVEVSDATTGKVLPGFAARESTVIRRDTMQGAVTWHGRQLGSLGHSRRIRLRFVLSAGDLYSFTVA